MSSRRPYRAAYSYALTFYRESYDSHKSMPNKRLGSLFYPFGRFGTGYLACHPASGMAAQTLFAGVVGGSGEGDERPPAGLGRIRGMSERWPATRPAGSSVARSSVPGTGTGGQAASGTQQAASGTPASRQWHPASGRGNPSKPAGAPQQAAGGARFVRVFALSAGVCRGPTSTVPRSGRGGSRRSSWRRRRGRWWSCQRRPF